MASLVYIRLIGLTAGTLVQLFWMVVILGYRRQRNFERVFFFLCLALFLFYSGSLLAVNAQIYYGHPPAGLLGFVVAIIIAGLCFFPALLLHLHMEFAETRGLLKDKRWKWAVAVLFYASSLQLIVHHVPLQITAGNFDFVLPGDSLKAGFAYLYSCCLAWCALWEFRFRRSASVRAERRFHGFLSVVFLLAILGVVSLHLIAVPLTATDRVILGVALAFLPIVPLAALIYLVGRHNFLQIGRQKNLVYAVSATFLALLYLSLVRRVSGWLAPMMPPEASAAILLFVLVIFIEPLQRLLGRRLQETAHREMDRVQRLTAEIQQEAKQGDVARLVQCIERRAREEFELASAKLTLDSKYAERSAALSGTPVSGDAGAPELERGAESPNRFRVGQGEHAAGVLVVQPHGAFLSGETSAGLEFFCEQLPNALELCLLIEEKLRLERELAERERLALVGQMAASISHNLKNPLGSIKTILQVQLENPEVPESIRGETRIVLDEVRRLSAKLNQLLQFSRPTVRSGSGTVNCDARVVIEEVVGVLRHEAEARGIDLGWRYTDGNSTVAASPEGLSEIVGNLVVNALEAAASGGHVQVNLGWLGGECLVCVEDDGPGIPLALQEKVLQPFFTTKAKGTGLGLAIVARRVAEFHGSLRFVSPSRDSRGTRCEVRLRSAIGRQNQAGGSR